MTSMTAKVGVIGAGVIGLSTAYHLTQLGVTDVLVLDRSHIASGSSGRSVGMVETQYREPLDIALRVLSSRMFNQFEVEHGLRITRNGYLRIGHSEADVRAFTRSAEIQHELGVADAVVLDGAEVGRRFPELRTDDVAAALYGPSDGFIDGHLYANLLAELVEGGGARVIQQTGVLAARVLANGQHELTTTDGTLACEFVVNAAGPWAEKIGSSPPDVNTRRATASRGAQHPSSTDPRLHDAGGDGLFTG